MKKLFTLKNCLIILFLLGIAIFFAIFSLQEFDNIDTYKSFISDNESFAEAYIRTIKSLTGIIITNFIISGFILAFIVLFFISRFKNISFIKFAFITLLFACFATYMIQIALPWFIQLTPDSTFVTGYVEKAITALITAIISIACYVYLLIKEIKQRKVATVTEPIVDTLEPIQEIAATDSTNNEPIQDNTTEQE